MMENIYSNKCITFFSRRSLSPIAIRASPLGQSVKRKCDLDERGDWGPHKKYQHFSPAAANHLAYGGPLLVTQLSSRLVYSIFSSLL
jgi:hypothetical protein